MEKNLLELLHFKNVGPAPELRIEFSPRLNFLAGDNGLGKTFLLDAAWWVPTRRWARDPLMPHGPPTEPTITFRHGTRSGNPFEHTSTFRRSDESWSFSSERPSVAGMVIYALADGGFSVWDPERNLSGPEATGRPSAFLFSAEEVWHGLPINTSMKLCNGLISDWATWQLEKGDAFEQLAKVLRALSPTDDEALKPGDLIKVSLADARRHPTLKMPYGQDVPLIHASAGMRRIVALAYLLVWTWQEHLAACRLQGTEPVKEILFLIDEIEAHLHPQWQRRIVPALLDVMEVLTGEHDASVQLVAATHSPLVTVSVESLFDESKDTIWELDQVDGTVRLQKADWYRRGDANAWLTSSVFDLKEARSIEAEKALSEALALLLEDRPKRAEVERVDGLLRDALGDTDRFWVRWAAWRQSHDEVAS